MQPLFELALHTGLRKGELLGLRWEDLDLAGGTASIRRTLQRTNLLEQGVELVVIKELLGHAHIGVTATATVYAHVRLRLQRDAINLLGHALRNPTEITGRPDDGDEPPLAGAAVR